MKLISLCLAVLFLGCNQKESQSEPINNLNEEERDVEQPLELNDKWNETLCIAAQKAIVKGIDSDQIKLKIHDDSSFSAEKTNVSSKVEIHGNLHGGDNLADQTIDCKLVSAERIKEQLSIETSPGLDCAAVNQLTSDLVFKQLTEDQKNRYLTEGIPLVFADDINTSTGGEWFRTQVSQFQSSTERGLEVASIALKAPWTVGSDDPTLGVHYCKLLSYDSIHRWMIQGAFEEKQTPLPIEAGQCAPRFEFNHGSCLFVPPFLGEDVCQDYSGLSWTQSDMDADCASKNGQLSTFSCLDREQIPATFGRCTIQCSKPFEKIWHLYSNPDKFGVDMNQVCDSYVETAPSWPEPAPTQKINQMLAGDDTDIYFPEGDSTLPALIFFQGGRVDKSYYQTYATQVARAGFLVIVPNHISSIFAADYFSELKQINLIQTELASMNSNPDSPLFQRWSDDQLGLLGHSFGGAAIIDGIQNVCRFPFCDDDSFTKPANLKAVALTGISTKPVFEDKIYPTYNGGLPIAFINGARDSNATLEDSLESYRLIADPPKMYVAVKGANHYNSSDRNNPPGPGPDDAAVLIPQSDAIAHSSYWTIAFLKAHILGDPEAVSMIYQNSELETKDIILKSSP